MRLLLPFGLSAVAAFVSSPALAGGLGVLVTGGAHSARAPYYDAAGEQYLDGQVLPNGGGGIEVVLGNDDDKIHGVMRLYAMKDAPLGAPDTGDVPADEAVYPDSASSGWSTKGVLTVGVQWSLLGDPKGKELVLTTLAGSGFATVDNLEYLQVDVGPGYNMMLGERLQLAASLTATGRYRKGLSVGPNVYAGLRYIFD